MVNFAVEAAFSTVMRKLQTDDPGHADVFNVLLQQLLNNDEFLMNNSGISKIKPTGDAAKDTAAFQAALNSASSAGTFLNVGGGTWNLTNELFVKKNTYILCDPGAVMVRKHTGYMIINGDRAIAAPGAYSGHGNITIKGGIWDANGANQPGLGSIFHFGHGEGIKVLESTLKDVVGSHHIEFNACKDIIVRDSKFLGWFGSGNVEAIQLDVAYPTLNNVQKVTLLPGDGSPCKNVLIEHNYFGSSGTPGSSELSRAIGGHNAIIGKKHYNIRILNNTIEKTTSYAIRPYNWSNLEISGNTLVECAAGIAVIPPLTSDPKDTITVDGTQTNASENNEDITIEKNKIIGGCSLSYPIIVNGEPTGRMKVVTINGNQISQIKTVNTMWSGIYFNYVDDGTADGNKVLAPGGSGIVIAGMSDGITLGDNVIKDPRIHGVTVEPGSKNITMGDNVIKRCGRTGILLDGAVGVTIGTNLIAGVNGNPEPGDDETACTYIKAINESRRLSISGNTGYNVSGFNAAMGLYITNTCSEVSRAGNNFYGLSNQVNATNASNGSDLG